MLKIISHDGPSRQGQWREYKTPHIIDYNIVDIVSKDGFKSVLLIGGIGVGKSISVREIANEMNINFILFDMSLYSNSYSVNNIYSGEDSIYNKIKDNSIILFDNIERANRSVVDIIMGVIEDKKIKDKLLLNSTIFLSATSNIKYGIGFSKSIDVVKYDNKKVINGVDYVINFNNIDSEAVSKFVEFNNIKNFDYASCDYVNYGFRGVKIAMKSKDLIK